MLCIPTKETLCPIRTRTSTPHCRPHKVSPELQLVAIVWNIKKHRHGQNSKCCNGRFVNEQSIVIIYYCQDSYGTPWRFTERPEVLFCITSGLLVVCCNGSQIRDIKRQIIQKLWFIRCILTTESYKCLNGSRKSDQKGLRDKNDDMWRWQSVAW